MFRTLNFMTNNSERLKQFLVIIATAGVIAFNYLAVIGYIGGVKPEFISNKNPTLITPSGFAFAIWSLIYLGLIAFSIYQALPANAERFKNLRSSYILSCAANCAWLYCWHHEAILVSVAVIFLLLGTLAFINIKLQKTASLAEFWLVKFPFGLYFGWVTAASILNATIALIYINFKISDSLAVILGAILLLTATALGVIIRFKLNNPFYPLAIAWALTAIAVKQSGQTLIVASAAVGVIILLITALSYLVNMNKTNDE